MNTLESSSNPTLLRVEAQLPSGVRLVSMHYLYDGEWMVTIGTDPQRTDASGVSMGYSDYYASAKAVTPNDALVEALALLDYRIANKIPMKKTIVKKPEKAVAGPPLDLDFSNLEIEI